MRFWRVIKIMYKNVVRDEILIVFIQLTSSYIFRTISRHISILEKSIEHIIRV